MTNEQWLNIVGLLKSNYRYNSFLPSKQISDMWFNIFNQYGYDDLMLGVTNYIRENDDPPQIRTLETYVKNAAEFRKRMARLEKQRNDPEKKEKLVKCPRCADKGYTLKTYPNFSETLIPCSCDKGRESWPWYFMTPEKLTEYFDEQERHGQRVSRFLINPPALDPAWEARYYSDNSKYNQKVKIRDNDFKKVSDRLEKMLGKIGQEQ